MNIIIKARRVICGIGVFLSVALASAESDCNWTEDAGKTDKENLLDLLQCLANHESHPLLKRHFQSVKMIMEKPDADFAANSITPISEVYSFFKRDGRELETYLNDPSRQFIMAFTSPTDGVLSYYFLGTPKNWNESSASYAMYLSLHGSGGGKNDNPLHMLFRTFSEKGFLMASHSAGDGFTICPWGRGDKGYKGISETDVWECLSDFDALYKTDSDRQHMFGFSMGGRGAWNLARKNTKRFASVGFFSPAPANPTIEEAVLYKNTPVFVCWGENERDSIKETASAISSLMEQIGGIVESHVMIGLGHNYDFDHQKKMIDFFQRHPKNQP